MSDETNNPTRRTANVTVRRISWRDAYWSEFHRADTAVRNERIHKKWQCLACGQCGFIEAAPGEDLQLLARRIGHGCQPESIAFYSPGAHLPLVS